MTRISNTNKTALIKGGNKNRRKNARSSGAPQKSDAVGSYMSDAWSLAKRTAYGLNEVRKLINIETKVLQNSNSGGVDWNGSLTSITTIVQGLNYTERVGNSIKLQQIEIKAKLLLNTASTGTVIRCILFRDLWQNGVAPAASNVLNQLGNATAPLQPYNWLLRDRVAIIADELVALSGSGDGCAALAWTIPHEGHVKFIGTTAAAASNGPGSVYMLFVSDETLNTPTVTWTTRVTFTDD